MRDVPGRAFFHIARLVFERIFAPVGPVIGTLDNDLGPLLGHHRKRAVCSDDSQGRDRIINRLNSGRQFPVAQKSVMELHDAGQHAPQSNKSDNVGYDYSRLRFFNVPKEPVNRPLRYRFPDCGIIEQRQAQYNSEKIEKIVIINKEKAYIDSLIYQGNLKVLDE